MNKAVQRDFFFNTLVEINRPDSFQEWFFYHGMLFDRYEKWWGKGGLRPSPHAGLDIGFYKDRDNRLQLLKNPFKIPVIADGTIVEISDDDFLGKSVFVRHGICDKNGKLLHSVYAHSMPCRGIMVNDKILKGDLIGTIADISKRNLSISGHLHLSMIWLAKDYQKNLLKWQLLPDSKEAVIVDPFEFIDCNYSSKPYKPDH